MVSRVVMRRVLAAGMVISFLLETLVVNYHKVDKRRGAIRSRVYE
jgi:hypothetical protein